MTANYGFQFTHSTTVPQPVVDNWLRCIITRLEPAGATGIVIDGSRVRRQVVRVSMREVYEILPPSPGLPDDFPVEPGGLA